MKLTKDTLPDYFTIASAQNSHYTAGTNTFDFVDQDSKILVATVGESWTWGSDLTEANDESIRLSHAFGNLVSTKLSANWLNLSQPGASNFFIADRVEELGKIISKLDYKKIYLICTFTEVGRAFNSHHDIYIDYCNWFQQNIIETKYDFYKFLKFLNFECLRRIRLVADQYNIEFKVGTNFVDAIGINNDPGFLPVPWFRLLNIECPVTAYTGSTGTTRLEEMIQFVPNKKRELFKSWFIELINHSNYIDRVCSSNKLVCTHPTINGHKMWANYILENIK